MREFFSRGWGGKTLFCPYKWSAVSEDKGVSKVRGRGVGKVLRSDVSRTFFMQKRIFFLQDLFFVW